MKIRRTPSSSESYHSVPDGWRRDDILALHAALKGSSAIDGADRFPERGEWWHYRETLYRLADGILLGDLASAEIAIRFIELRFIGSYSGFVRSLLARRLKRIALTDCQKTRLHEHFTQLVINRVRTDEYRAYVSLWRHLITHHQLQNLSTRLQSDKYNQIHVAWLLARLTTRNRTNQCYS